MVAITNPDLGYITARRQQLANRFSHKHAVMRELDDWRTIDRDTATRLQEEIWGPGAHDRQQVTILLPYIEAMTDTLVAIFAAREPKFQVIARNSISHPANAVANALERKVRALYHKLNDLRDVSLGDETAEFVFHRGEVIYKVLYLSAEQRGEVREPIDDIDIALADGNIPLNETRIVEEGDFPIFVDILDPLDCYYQLDRKKQPIEFIHEVGLHWDEVIAMFPDIVDKPEFKNLIKSSESAVYTEGTTTVIDYWNTEVNAIIVAGKFYKKPTPHKRKSLPFVIQPVRTKLRSRRSANGPSSNVAVRYRESTPFCKAMLEPIKHASRAESILASHVKKMAFSPFLHRGIDPTGGHSFWVKRAQNPDGNDTGGALEYTLQIDASMDSAIIPLTVGEDIGHLEAPRIADHVIQFLQGRSEDLAMVSVAKSFLTGAMEARLSGYSQVQQKQLAVARWEPYHEAINRALSRMLRMVIDTLYEEWDREDGVPFLLDSLTGDRQEDVQLTKDDLANIQSLTVRANPMVPIDREQEWQALFQANSVGAMSLYDVIEKMGESEDPDDTLMRIAFEQTAMQDPRFRMGLAMAYAKKNHLDIPGQEPPPQPQPQPQPATGPVQMDPAMAGAPVDPMMGQMTGPPVDPMMGAAPGGGQPQLSPELLAALMANQGGGSQ